MLERAKIFFEEAKRELSRVNWPTRRRTASFTLAVVTISLVLAAFLGVWDFLFAYLIKLIIV